MDIVEVEARPREGRGSGACRRMRRQELVPAVLYGRGQPNVLLSLRLADLEKLLEARTLVARLIWNGHQDNVQMRQVQYDALGDHVRHVDFVRISLTETVTVTVPVEPHGQAAGAAQGGMLEQVLHELEVECLPTAIPEQFRVEVGEMEIGDDLRVGAIEFPAGVTPTAGPETVVLLVTPPAVALEEEEEVEEAEAMAEPEVIGRKAEAKEPVEE